MECRDIKLPCAIYPLPLLVNAIKTYKPYCDVEILEASEAWTLLRVTARLLPARDPHQDLIAEFLNYALDLAATESHPIPAR